MQNIDIAAGNFGAQAVMRIL